MTKFPDNSGVAALAVVFALSGSLPAFSQSSDPAWLEELSQQLAIEKECQVDYYVNVREGQLTGKNTYDARAQCRDGRQFDASRIEPAKQFVIRPCGTVVC